MLAWGNVQPLWSVPRCLRESDTCAHFLCRCLQAGGSGAGRAGDWGVCDRSAGVHSSQDVLHVPFPPSLLHHHKQSPPHCSRWIKHATQTKHGAYNEDCAGGCCSSPDDSESLNLTVAGAVSASGLWTRGEHLMWVIFRRSYQTWNTHFVFWLMFGNQSNPIQLWDPCGVNAIMWWSTAVAAKVCSATKTLKLLLKQNPPSFCHTGDDCFVHFSQ